MKIMYALFALMFLFIRSPIQKISLNPKAILDFMRNEKNIPNISTTSYNLLPFPKTNPELGKYIQVMSYNNEPCYQFYVNYHGKRGNIITAAKFVVFEFENNNPSVIIGYRRERITAILITIPEKLWKGNIFY